MRTGVGALGADELNPRGTSKEWEASGALIVQLTLLKVVT